MRISCLEKSLWNSLVNVSPIAAEKILLLLLLLLLLFFFFFFRTNTNEMAAADLRPKAPTKAPNYPKTLRKTHKNNTQTYSARNACNSEHRRKKKKMMNKTLTGSDRSRKETRSTVDEEKKK
jgi:hypothetical protein